MSQYYPQAIVILRISFEDFKRGTAARDLKPYVLTVIPKSVDVTINDYTTADTFSLTLDYKNFPFDPRTIRAVGVSIHIEDMKSLKYGDDRIDPTPSNAVFQGFADKSEIELNEGTDEVRINGRDFTGLLVDAKWDGSLVPLSGKTTLQVIEWVVKRLESTKTMKVEGRGLGGLTPTINNIGIGLDDDTLKGKRPSRKNETYWDIIQELAGRAGLIAYIEIDRLVVTKPRAIYTRSESKQFIYGHNLESLSLSRKIGRFQDINVEVSSFNPSLNPPLIRAEIPADATQSFKRRLKLPDGPIYVKARTSEEIDPTRDAKDPTQPGEAKLEKAEVIPFRIPNIKSKNELVNVGEAIFEELSRQQLEGSLKTKEMCVRDRQGVEFDITKIRIGTPVEIKIDYEYITGIRQSESYERRYKYLVNRSYDPIVAKELARVVGDLGTPFYTRSVEFSFSSDEGFSMDLDFINFIEIDKDLLKPKASYEQSSDVFDQPDQNINFFPGAN